MTISLARRVVTRIDRASLCAQVEIETTLQARGAMLSPTLSACMRVCACVNACVRACHLKFKRLRII